jgi:hypothetical protein
MLWLLANSHGDGDGNLAIGDQVRTCATRNTLEVVDSEIEREIVIIDFDLSRFCSWGPGNSPETRDQYYPLGIGTYGE